jgi:hypothetical protein
MLGAGITAAACSSASTDPAARLTGTDSVKAALIGSWNLTSVCGGIAGQCLPSSTWTEPQRYVFRSDDSVEAYRGGQRVFTLQYIITAGATDPSRGDTRPNLLIGLGPTVDPRPLKIRFSGDTTLVLDEGCCDRYAFEYRRNR